MRRTARSAPSRRTHHQHAAAGAGAAERSDVRRSRARAGAARASWKAAADPQRALRFLFREATARRASRGRTARACSNWRSGELDHYKQASGAGGEADRRRRVESRPTWKPRNWRHGPRWPAPSSIWMKPSPRNRRMDDHHGVSSFRAPAPASALPRSLRCWPRTASPQAKPAPPAACPGCRISRPRPSASSTCTSPAGRRSWTCSTTSRRSTNCPARSCPAACAWASASPA